MEGIVEILSDHHDARKGDGPPRYVMLHYTGTRTAREAADVYLGRVSVSGGRVAPHYMVDTDGTITRFVPESRRAWHAGVSFWRGHRDLNSLSIGIEIVNEGQEGGYPPYPAPQIKALIRLCRDILQRHELASKNVLGHSDVAPARRYDPGPSLDWARLAAAGVGIWPMPKEGDRTAAASLAGRMDEALRAYGYDPDVQASVRLRAFRSRFHPEALEEEGHAALEETAARLAWLLRHDPPPSGLSGGPEAW
jgi:N-acetylmuramoyl-L-alanine amidase